MHQDQPSTGSLPQMPQRRFLLTFALLLAVILVAVFWLDRPLARLLAEFHTGRAIFTSKPVQLPVMLALSWLALAVGAGHLALRRRLPKWVEAALIAGAAVLIGSWITHELLKPLFGRIPPGAYLRSGHFGFHWFHKPRVTDSFPSGHMTEASACFAVLWRLYPRGRWVYAGLMVLLAIGLMLGQWHYLSDVLAGLVTGGLTGLATLGLWRFLTRRWPGLRHDDRPS
ncbi:phosphatase PAP2 family protein [Thioclava sp. BHET1]|nr:phosphatase PAP2 family protein [Thioclava sp. BHET1]